MHKILFIIIAFLSLGSGLAAQNNFFESVQVRELPSSVEVPKTVKKMGIYRLNEPALRAYLLGAPMRFQNNGITLPLDIPMPDGTVETFEIVEAPILAPEIAAQNPEIKSYAGNSRLHKSASIRFTLTSNGFNAIILGLEGDNVYFEKYARALPDVYFNYFTSDAIAPDKHNQPACGVGLHDLPKELETENGPGTGGIENNTGGTLRTFRLVMAANVEFTAQNGGTQASGLAAVMVYVNNMTAVYEQELAVTFTLVSGVNMIFTTEPDGYTNVNEGLMIDENQVKADAVVGVGNYDVGHVLGFYGPGNSGGGVAYSPSICSSVKAGGASKTSTGYAQVFYDQLVMHEVGHQFGMSHSYNSNIPVCTTRSQGNSVEPGSGATIMSYGFTCGTDDYPTAGPFLNFHSNSYSQGVATMTGSCAATSATGNNPPVVTMPGSFTIPKSTPFSLTGSATDADAGLTYSWEGMNTGEMADPDATVLADPTKPPFFRSYAPTTSPTRVFPPLARILDGSNYDVGEKLPSVSVITAHRLTVRDNRAGAGGVSFGTTNVTVDGNVGPFLVTSNLSASFAGLSSQTVTWSVNGTAVATPNVKISLSTDGGQTFPNVLAASTANDGSESVILTNIATSNARIKVEAVGNIFFDISNSNFTITAALPVELVRFEARLNGENTALLTWQTATEVNNQGYDVEMAINDGTFRKVSFVKGKGNTTSTSNYEFLVPNLTRELHYFRLKMIDVNGEFAYSPVRTLQLSNVKDVVNIYPNPAQDGMLQITLTQSDAEQIQAELINSIGQLVSTVQLINNGTIMRLQLPASGVYSLVMRLDNGNIITRRVVRL